LPIIFLYGFRMGKTLKPFSPNRIAEISVLFMWTLLFPAVFITDINYRYGLAEL
jgi:hypothetical protein